MSDTNANTGIQGPLVWAAAAVGGALVGWLLAIAVPGVYDNGHAIVPLWLVAPFGLLLGSIAVMPFAAPHFWHRHYPAVSFFLGAIVAAYYLIAFNAPSPVYHPSYGAEKMLHSAEEFYSFIALVGGLYVVSGGILVEVGGRGRAVSNTIILLIGAFIANLVGTTGASMLLIRPFMRMNQGRLTPLHIVFFIFIVSNCGGCLTPIGDPPLYLGYLKGVPFIWTLQHLWYDWLFIVGGLLVAFFVFDSKVGPGTNSQPTRPGNRISGAVGLICLVLMLVGVFIPPMLKHFASVDGLLVGATFQIAVAIASYKLAPKRILEANAFTFAPVKEVGLLFAGIFATMVPALGYLAKHGGSLGLDSPTAFYYGTGSLSAVLDNAPTYLSFLQIAFGDTEVSPATISTFLSTSHGVGTLNAISTGAVFFGAMTYIGNGPNFMVKSIAEAAGVQMPSFFGYLGRACLILLPLLIIHWLIFIR